MRKKKRNNKYEERESRKKEWIKIRKNERKRKMERKNERKKNIERIGRKVSE